MKKISKWLSAAAAALIAGVMTAVTAFAADDDICLFEGECTSPRSWGQAFAYNLHEEGKELFCLSELNEKTKLYVEFELLSEPMEDFAGLEFILYKRQTEDADSIWARVNPLDVTDGVATFDYPSMVEAVGSDDLSIIDSIYVGDTDNGLKVTKVTFDINGDGLEGAPAEEEKSDDNDNEDKSEETTAKSADKETNADSEDAESESGGVNIVLIVVIAVVVIAVVVVVIVLKTRKRYY